MVKPCLSCEDQFEPASGLNYAKYLRMRQASSADTFPTSSDSPGLTKASPLPSHTVAESTGHGWSVPCRIRVVPDPAPPLPHPTMTHVRLRVLYQPTPNAKQAYPPSPSPYLT